MRILLGFAFLGIAAAQPTVNNVVNAGSNDARFCPGLLVTITGNNFGNNPAAITVVAGAQAAGIISANNNVIQAQLPFGLSSAATTLSVNVGDLSSNPVPLAMSNYAPAFYGDSPFGTKAVTAGQTMTAMVVGLGETTPLVPAGSIPAAPAPTVATPTVTIGGVQATSVAAALSTTAAGVYQVSFIVPTGLPSGTPLDVVVSIGNTATPKKSVVLAAPSGAPLITSVVNAGNPAAGLAPGVLAIISGQNFVSPTVNIGLKLAYIAESSLTSILVQLPVDLPAGTQTLSITTPGFRSAPMDLTINSYAPAFYGPFHDPNGTPFTGSNPATPGKKVIGLMVGLGPTSPGVPTGQPAGTIAPTATTPTITVGNKAANFTYCGLVPTLIGTYEIDFVVPDDAPAGNPDVVLTIAGVKTPPQPLATAALVPTLIGFRNAASGQLKDPAHGIAPNTFLSIYTTNAGAADSTGNLFPRTDYQGTKVLFNGTAVPLYNVVPSANLINVVVPSELPESGTANVTIVNQNGASQNLTLNLAPADVGIFRIPADSSNPSRQIAAATIANTAWNVLPAATAAAYRYSPCPSQTPLAVCAGPAHPGDSIVIFFTGGGRVTPNQVPTGSVAPLDGSVIYRTAVTPALKIGGLDAPVLFSGISPGTAAEYQINTVIPAGVTPGDDVPVVLSFGSSSDTVTIAVQK